MWGTAGVRRLCRHARKLGYRRLALTDTDNLYGLWPFLESCQHEGLTPMVGAELSEPVTGTAKVPLRRAVCLVESAAGYANLCRLLTRRHQAQNFRLAAELPRLSQGLVVLTSSADLLRHLHAARVWVAAAMPRRPLSRQHPLCRMARRLAVPLVAVPGCFFLESEAFAVHRMMRAIDLNRSLSQVEPRDMAPRDAWLAAPEDYACRFAVCPQALRASEKIAERLAFRGPQFGLVMPPWQSPDGRSAAQWLRQEALHGARRRYGRHLPGRVKWRLAHELEIINRMQFAAYFLVVRDIVRKSPRICGRGSGAASLVAYCLEITNVCPIKHNLYFERFLNPGRKDAPDIDVDFAWDERDALQAAVLEQFRGRAAMVCNHVGFKPRGAVRETAKVFGLSDAEIGRVTKRLPWFWRSRGDTNDGALLNEVKQLPEMKGHGFPPPWPDIMGMAQRFIGAPRHLSVHSGGVVITPEPIDSYVPVQQAPKGVPIIQWEKEATEAAGLVKIDLLGNRSLGVIRDAVANVRTNGVEFEEWGWTPEEDAATRHALARGHTMGCFYIESPATRLLQQKARVGDFEHLVIHSSIIRPAANDFIREYVRRLHGGAWTPIHPRLAGVLDETYGIMVYQEDVSRAAVAVAGFSHVDADGLRKVMSKKEKVHQLRDYYQRFRKGARANGVDADSIEAIWAMMMSFDGYSFCKPHSASYARVSFQAAYLRVHHPAEFMAAVISNQGGYYSTFAYVSEARRMGLQIAPPHVNHSRIAWTGADGSLQVGLMAVKGMSAATLARISAERDREPFNDSGDFLRRVHPDESEARALIDAGALDGLGGVTCRTQLRWALAVWQKRRRERRAQPMDTLFAAGATPAPPTFPVQAESRRLWRELGVLGFLCDRHPLSLFKGQLAGLQRIKAVDLHRYTGRRVRLAGWLITGKRVRTKHGDPMEFLSFEDETALFETTFFPRIYARFCHFLETGRPYLLIGTVDEDWGAYTLTVQHVTCLDSAAAGGTIMNNNSYSTEVLKSA
jgi:DNA polymerase-3 subunit alpha/error-prone DNA polymerase